MRWCEKLTHPTNAALVTHDPTWKVSLSERELEKLQSHLFVEVWKKKITRYFLNFEMLWANSKLNYCGSKLPERPPSTSFVQAHQFIFIWSHITEHDFTYTFSLTLYHQWFVKSCFRFDLPLFLLNFDSLCGGALQFFFPEDVTVGGFICTSPSWLSVTSSSSQCC